MHESIVVRPTADTVEPSVKHAKLAIAPVAVQVFQKENGRNFLLQYGAGKQLIRYPHEEVDIMLLQNFLSAMPQRAPQIRGIPSVGFDLILEEPLDSRRMLARTALPQSPANAGRN